MRVQLWGAGVPSPHWIQGLREAGCAVESPGYPEQIQPGMPLLLLYREPVQELGASLSATQAGVAALQALHRDLSPLLARMEAPVRLVNESCAVLPQLVGWCVDPGASPVQAWPHAFLKPDPLEAVLVLRLLAAEPNWLAAYQALEAHPLAAALDQRPLDLSCAERYEEAAGLTSLFAAREERRALEVDLQELASQLAPVQDQQLQTLALSEQLEGLKQQLPRALELEDVVVELRLTLEAQQSDLECMSRRLALLEDLVARGSDASQRLQGRLAQALV